MCKNKATSVEHAPAKCFFPKKQRSQLITVPSCSFHNEKTSKDDEYVRNIFIGFAGAQDAGKQEVLATTFRSFDLSPSLKASVRSCMEQVSYQGRDFWTVRLNWERIERTMHKIACALHRSHYRTPLNVSTSTVMRAGLNIGIEKQDDTNEIFGFIERASLSWHGKNP